MSGVEVSKLPDGRTQVIIAPSLDVNEELKKLREPTREEMMAAFTEFKKTRLFAALLNHQDPKWILENEGFLWSVFYNGYMEGAKR